MTSRLLRGAAVAAVALSVNTGVAAAKGGGATPAPAPAPGIDCYADPAVLALTTDTVAVNYAGDAGCVGVDYANGLRLAFVVTNPGWTYVVTSNGDGTSQRVQIQFTQTATGRKIDFRYELGKTRVG